MPLAAVNVCWDCASRRHRGKSNGGRLAFTSRRVLVCFGLGYVDFKDKIGGVGKCFTLTGDIEKTWLEFAPSCGFYRKNPQQFET